MHIIYIEPIDPIKYGGFTHKAECSGCGIKAAGATRLAAEQMIERLALRSPCVRAHEESQSDSDEIRIDDATGDTQHDVPIDQGSSEQSPSTSLHAIIDPGTHQVKIITSRWTLFTNDELTLIGENLNEEIESEFEDTRINHFNAEFVALLQQIILGINDELNRRDLKLPSDPDQS